MGRIIVTKVNCRIEGEEGDTIPRQNLKSDYLFGRHLYTQS